MYLVRHATPLLADMEEQAADSHFMVDRLKFAFLFGGAGLFCSKSVGRLIFRGVVGDVTWDTQLDFPDPFFGGWPDATTTTQVADWYGAICAHNVLRLAANDAYLALTHPHEALLYAYRGMEWIVVGTKISWEDLAKDIGVSTADLREFKKTANVEGGARHPTQSLQKLRADLQNCSGWVTCLFDAINAARTRLDPSYTPKTPKMIRTGFNHPTRGKRNRRYRLRQTCRAASIRAQGSHFASIPKPDSPACLIRIVLSSVSLAIRELRAFPPQRNHHRKKDRKSVV